MMGSADAPPTWLGNAAHARWLEQEADALLRFAHAAATLQAQAGFPEALSAAAALHLATGEEGYEAWYRTWWDFAVDHLVERPGAWVHELGPDNLPKAVTWSGKPDVYHALQATLIPRLPLAPALAPALAAGALDRPAGPCAWEGRG